MGKPCALQLASTPLSHAPPNISRRGSTVNHTSRSNVRGGGRRERKTAKSRCLILGLSSRCMRGVAGEKLSFTSPNLRF